MNENEFGIAELIPFGFIEILSLLPDIKVGDELIFEKEPNNKEDSNAICIKTRITTSALPVVKTQGI